MAALFWVGGTGTWDGLSLLHWSTSSGGAANALAVPGSGDTVTFDGSSGGGTVTVNTNFSVVSVTMGAFTGTLDFSANNNSPTMQTFNCSGTGTITLNMGSGTWTLTGTGTVWNTGTSTGLTQNAGTSSIKITDTSASSKTFDWGTNGTPFYNLQLTAGAGTIILGTSSQAGTFNDITVLGAPLTTQIFAGKVITLLNPSNLGWAGTAGNLNTFQSTSNGVAWTVSSTTTLNEDYISLQDSTGAGAIPFFAGIHSTLVSGNTNWVLTDAIPTSENAKRDENRVPTLVLVADSDGKATLIAYADPNSHGLIVEDGTSGQDFSVLTASRDGNRVTSLLATSSSDNTTPINVYADSDTNAMFISSN